MNSKQNDHTEAYVWVWLPGEIAPIVAGILTQSGPELKFMYGKSYLQRENKISLNEKELPLQNGEIPLLKGLSMPGTIRDGSPDAWGRRVLINKKYGGKGSQIDVDSLSELTYLLESGSDRIGGLDFQAEPNNYLPRGLSEVTLEELVTAAEKVEKGIPLSPDLDLALYHGSAIGGARPKALVEEGNKKYIAKFSSSNDTYSIIKAEFIAMKLAEICGINVAKVKQVSAAHKDVLLVERFDRKKVKGGWERKIMHSALTLLELEENNARYASYQDLSEIIRSRFQKASSTLRELYSRLVFNIIVGNNDDHARNHAAFWDGRNLSLTPAYDICPQARTGNMSNQGMLIKGEDKQSKISTCLDAADIFMLSETAAFEIVEKTLSYIVENWSHICDEATVTSVDKNLFKERQFLNPFIFEDLDAQKSILLLKLAKEFKALP